MKIYPFKACFPNPKLMASPDSFFLSVSKEYNHFKSAGFFNDAPGKALYIYRIEGENTYTGIIGSNDISDIEDGKILGHEHTITEKEQKMMSLMLLRKAMIKPVLLAYEKQMAIDDFIEKFIRNNTPFFTCTMEAKAERHTLWAVNADDDVALLKQLFKKNIQKAYIADGHHRAVITARLVRQHYLHDHDDDKRPGLLCAYFPFSDLTIYDFNRLVDISGIMTETRFMALLSCYFDIFHIPTMVKPHAKFQLTMHINHEWYSIVWKKEILDAFKDRPILLDVDLFNDFVLNKILNIKDIKSATEVKYVEGILDTAPLINTIKAPKQILFFIYPVTKEEVIRTSDQKGVLPPKSTWFEPRMHNAMIIKEF